MIKNKLTKNIFLFLLLMLITLTGCTAAEKPSPDLNNMLVDQDEIDRYIIEDNERRKNDVSYQQVIKAEAIADALVREEKIYDATVVLYDDHALVGIEIVEDIQGNISKEIREKVQSIVKEMDNKINTVTISSDDEIFNKIDKLQHSLIKGDERKNISKEIDSILKEIDSR